MNLYEIRLENDIIYNTDLLEAFFFDCQCALFLVDGKNKKSIDAVKEIMTKIENEKYPFMKRIIVENKSDINREEEENKEIKKLLNFYPYLYKEEISLKTGDNFENLLNQIYKEINSNSSEKNSFPLDQVAKCALSVNKRENYEGSISLILLGDSGVGKSNFMSRYSKNSFNLVHMATIGMEQTIKTLKINGKNFYHLTLWDTSGQERFRSLPRKYYRNADGILLLFDIGNKDSFENIKSWMKDITDNLGEKKENNIIIYLLANKIDLFNTEKEKITKEEKEELAYKLGVKCYDISCKWNLNIDEVMAKITLECIKNNKSKKKENKKTIKTQNLRNQQNNENKREGCC